MTLSFKDSMSSLDAENKDMALKVTNKAEGYQWTNLNAIVKEYNEWYELQTDLPPVKYVLSGSIGNAVKQ